MACLRIMNRMNYLELVIKHWKRYLKGLLKLNSDDASINNAPLCFMEAATARNLKTGMIIGKYMGTAFDQDRTDYYEAWLEIID